MSVPEESRSSRNGLARTPEKASDGPMARTITLLGCVPVTMKPPIRTLSPVSTRRRVEMLPKVGGAGVAEGLAVGVDVGVGVMLGVVVGVAVGVGVGVCVGVGVGVGVGLGGVGVGVVGVGVGVGVVGGVGVGVGVIPGVGVGTGPVISRNAALIGPQVWKPWKLFTPRPRTKMMWRPTDRPVVFMVAVTGSVCASNELMMGMAVPPAQGGVSM